MTDHKCFTAEFQAFVKEFPELILIALGNDANLGQVDGNNPLIEAAFKFIVSILILPRYEEASASHGGKDIAFIVFAHLLGRNIVRIHPFNGAAYSKLSQVIILTTLEAVIFIKDINQFREGRSNVDTGFILDAFQTLLEDFSMI